MTPRAVQLVHTMTARWDSIDPVRRAVMKLLHAWGEDGLDDALGMATSELLENAVKHGVPGGPVELRLTAAGSRCELRVTNAVEVPSPHPQNLQSRLEWLRSFPHSEDAYRAALDLTAGAVPGSSGNLGLARIFHEAGCAVTTDVTQPGQVTVVAVRSSGLTSA